MLTKWTHILRFRTHLFSVNGQVPYEFQQNRINAFKPRPPGENKGYNPLSQPISNYCEQSGHIVSDCPVLKSKRE